MIDAAKLEKLGVEGDAAKKLEEALQCVHEAAWHVRELRETWGSRLFLAQRTQPDDRAKWKEARREYEQADRTRGRLVTIERRLQEEIDGLLAYADR